MTIKNTIIASFILGCLTCGVAQPRLSGANVVSTTNSPMQLQAPIITGADNFTAYLPELFGKRVGVLTNQTGIVNHKGQTHHLVDFLINNSIDVRKIYAPEHGFRGTADAGEHIVDGKDTQTGLPIISLYGNNKKPSKEQLEGIDIVVFDLQDVGARFYTYISSLHYLMEACAEQNIEVMVLDRPNPNGGIVDGPILDMKHSSFVGMHPVPVLHGMTIGEYAQMINGEGWLAHKVKAKLKVIPCQNYKRTMEYSLPVAPSPNLPNVTAINLYASLCFFEGTNVSVGRGTDKQFQIYGSPYLENMSYTFTPMPNRGAKDPMHNGVLCYGEDLSMTPPVNFLDLRYLIKAYQNTKDKSKFFTKFFTKLAGTEELQKQIESGKTAKEIKATWQPGLQQFTAMRRAYLIYPR